MKSHLKIVGISSLIYCCVAVIVSTIFLIKTSFSINRQPSTESHNMNYNRPLIGDMGTSPTLYGDLDIYKCMLNETIICVIIYLISVYLIYIYCKHLFEGHEKNMLIKYKNLDSSYMGSERTTLTSILGYIAPILWFFIIIFVIAFVIYPKIKVYSSLPGYIEYDSVLMLCSLLMDLAVFIMYLITSIAPMALLLFSILLITSIFYSHETIVSDNFIKFIDNEIIKSDKIYKKYPEFITYLHEILPIIILLIIAILILPIIPNITRNIYIPIFIISFVVISVIYISDYFLKYLKYISDNTHKNYFDSILYFLHEVISYFRHEIVSVTSLLKYLPYFILLIIAILIMPDILNIYKNALEHEAPGTFIVIWTLFIIIIVQPFSLLTTVIENKISNTPKLLSVFRLAESTMSTMVLALVCAFMIISIMAQFSHELSLAEHVSNYTKTIFVIVSFSISYFVIFSILAITKGVIFIRKIITIPISIMIYFLSLISINTFIKDTVNFQITTSIISIELSKLLAILVGLTFFAFEASTSCIGNFIISDKLYNRFVNRFRKNTTTIQETLPVDSVEGSTAPSPSITTLIFSLVVTSFMIFSLASGFLFTQSPAGYVSYMSNVDAAIDKNGSIHLVWEEYTNETHVICYGVKNESNDSYYSKRIISTNNINSYDPKIELSSDAVFVTWQSDYNGCPVISLAKSTDGGLTWNNTNLSVTNLSITDYDYFGDQEIIGGNQQIVNTENGLYVFWNELITEGWDRFKLYSRNSSDGGLTWNPTISLDVHLRSSDDPPIFKIKKSDDGKIHLLGIDDGGGRSVGVFYKYL